MTKTVFVPMVAFEHLEQENTESNSNGSMVWYNTYEDAVKNFPNTMIMPIAVECCSFIEDTVENYV